MLQAGRFDGSEPAPSFLAGDGVTHRLIRSLDWARTPIGPVENWPHSLKTMVGVMLHSRHPMFLWWGPELIQFYNDAYLPSFGQGKHPAAMGQPGRECWQEIWPIIGPQIDDVMRHGKPCWNEDHLVPIFRNGRIEEVYWTYGYSAVYDDAGKIGGTLVVCTETTARVISARRLHTLHLLAEQSILATDKKTLLETAAQLLASESPDLAFVIGLSKDPRSGALVLGEVAGISEAQAREILTSHYDSLLGCASAGSAPEDTRHLELREPLSLARVPDPVRSAFVVPIARLSAEPSRDFLLFGLNPRLPFDDAYRSFVCELAEQLSLVLSRLESLRERTQSEDERKNLLLQAPIATALLTGPEHVYQIANPLYCQLVRRTEQQLLGKAYRQIFPELANTPLLAILDRVYQQGEPFVSNEFLLPFPRGSDGVLEDCFFKFNLEPLRDGNGDVYGMMAVAVDITEQVRARRILEKAHDERARLLEQLEAASRAKDEFLAMLGHELRNPLTPIVTALELMKMEEAGRPHRARQIIERQVGHLTRLVDDLLDVAKITRGKIELKKERTELAEVVSKAVEIASLLIEQRRHHLLVDVAQSGMQFDGDPVRIAQVIANLLTNAARYTDPGGTIRVAATRDGADFVITVRDNGRGIDAEMLPRIFDIFVQGQRSADRAEGGLGLGLALVKNLVALHGGTVSATSDGAGRGTEFAVRLPRMSTSSETESPRALAAEPALSPAESSLRILVVDDNADAADMLAEALRISGHEVSVAYEPIAALRMAEKVHPQVALLDIGLPGIDGYELAVRLREKIETRSCRLLAITGYGQEHDRIRSEAAGFAAHLIKPVDFRELRRLIAGE